MTTSKWRVTSGKSGFTMIEIAISLAVIGFALVAIVGILPLGLNVQKDNREDTIASQDGQYFMDLLRYGRQGTREVDGQALDFLTNYVESIDIKTYVGTNFVFIFDTDVTYTTPNTAGVNQSLTNGHVIVGLLSTPKYQRTPTGIVRHDVVATVRAMSGSALEQNGGNQLVAFKYQMDVTLMPYSATPWMNYAYTNYQVGMSDVSLQTNQNQLAYLQKSLIDARLQFSWPVLPSGPGPNRKYFRTLVSGQFQDISLPSPGNADLFLYVINPGAYTTSRPPF
ncbi:MAG: type IV pilus modification PilV family protein [Limisphaerales bacterium]